MASGSGRALVAHPSAELYGSDRQVLESVRGLRAHGWTVTTALPVGGPLVEEIGGDVRVIPMAVLRKSAMTPAGFARLLASTPASLARAIRVLRSVRPDVVYVNTIVLPVWQLAATLCRVPVVVHVHEAEEDVSRLVRTGLAAPLLLARRVVANSRAARRALVEVVPSLAERTSVVYNGVPHPDGLDRASGAGAGPRSTAERGRLVFVGRLSPRKGPDVALEAVALLRARGHDVSLDLCGSTFDGYEWFEDQLRARARQPDLQGRVRFLGYVRDVAPVIADGQALLVPSRQEPFGNIAVEGMLVGRPVVASAVQGLSEIVADGETGWLVPPDDAEALAGAVAEVLADPHAAGARAAAGQRTARERFLPEAYHANIARVLAEVRDPEAR